ncbi:hypothetical protein EJB05_47987, partial [Eragrostis curvula]
MKPTCTVGLWIHSSSLSMNPTIWIPDPYGIEIRNPPDGYEEKRFLNVHAIDMRGVTDKLGCTECRCDLYNVSVDEYGLAIRKNYTGGRFYCYDQTRCKVREGFNGGLRKLFLRYTVTWLDWSTLTDWHNSRVLLRPYLDAVVPVKIFIFDDTDRSLLDGKSEHACKLDIAVDDLHRRILVDMGGASW